MVAHGVEPPPAPLPASAEFPFRSRPYWSSVPNRDGDPCVSLEDNEE